MQYLAVLLVAAIVFSACYLFDKGFEKIFRNQSQHYSGLSSGALLIVCGSLILLMGFGLVIYYATFGIFYDEDSFILTTFGKKSNTYRYRDIKGQRLYLIQGGSVVVELHMTDGRSVSLQSVMTGAYDFLDHAFDRWCRQTRRDPESCDFHDTANHLWFPTLED